MLKTFPSFFKNIIFVILTTRRVGVSWTYKKKTERERRRNSKTSHLTFFFIPLLLILCLWCAPSGLRESMPSSCIDDDVTKLQSVREDFLVPFFIFYRSFFFLGPLGRTKGKEKGKNG